MQEICEATKQRVRKHRKKKKEASSGILNDSTSAMDLLRTQKIIPSPLPCYNYCSTFSFSYLFHEMIFITVYVLYLNKLKALHYWHFFYIFFPYYVFVWSLRVTFLLPLWLTIMYCWFWFPKILPSFRRKKVSFLLFIIYFFLLTT